MDTQSQSTSLAALRALSSNASTALASAPWWRRPINQALLELLRGPPPRKPPIVVPKRTAQVVASGDRPQGVIYGGESGGLGAVRVEQLATRQVYGASGPAGVPEGRRQVITAP
jgi:hypothetical protein